MPPRKGRLSPWLQSDHRVAVRIDLVIGDPGLTGALGVARPPDFGRLPLVLFQLQGGQVAGNAGLHTPLLRRIRLA